MKPNDCNQRSSLLIHEDWWAVWFGFTLIFIAVFGIVTDIPKSGKWSYNPLVALSAFKLIEVFILGLGLSLLSSLGMYVMGYELKKYLKGFLCIFLLAVLANIIGSQTTLKGLGLSYAFWALALGLSITNTINTPHWIIAGARSEIFVKTGLVLLGAEILVQNIIILGGQGLIVAWIVTPVVVLAMWFFGTRVLKMTSKPLVMVIACATSVCGVSAAIASAAACRAKKEELTLTVGMTMIFTTGMMVGMPALCKLIGLNEFVGGAWIGGTVDSTGAVVASGAMLGEKAEQVAAIVKMIQNILIGIIAFIIALYWVSTIERKENASGPSIVEIWYRFPKFIVGFLGASLLFSLILVPILGEDEVKAIHEVTKGLRGWFFALAFVSIGLETNFRQIASQLVGGKPIWLYISGQAFNIILTLLAAYLAFGGILFKPPS